MCLFIVWNPHWVQQTLQFMPLVLELFLIQSHLLWGEFSICALCCSYSQSMQFSFLVPPGTHHCWVDRSGVIWEACPTPLHMTVSAVMCYHCVRVAVGPHCHVCSTRRQDLDNCLDNCRGAGICLNMRDIFLQKLINCINCSLLYGHSD